MIKSVLKAGALALTFLSVTAHAQDDLVKKAYNANDSARKFKFTTIINLENTPVKNQGSSGTCWSYATNSFLESEMVRMGKQPVEIAQIYTARCVYKDKAENYLRMQGNAGWGDGGECHDVINMFAKYGAMPQTAYTGLQYGAKKNQFAEMQGILKGMLDALVKNPNGKISPGWRKAFDAVLDAYLGPVPETFTWNGKTYTPRTFADQVVGINPAEYVELTSYTFAPYYEKTMLWAPDNWSYDMAWNVKMDDITDIIDYALKNGYSVSWATDVSEKYFSWKNGVAFVPEKEYEDMNEDEIKNMWNGPQKERVITSEMRQAGLDNFTTTDDHGMHIVGMAKDQNGSEYYIVKNSWGTKNDHKGYLYVSKPFVKLKTTGFLLNKGGIPPALRKKMKMS